MKLVEIFAFEMSYQLRRVWTWLFLATVFVVTYLLATQVYVGDARADGYFFNAPFVIAKVTFLGSLLGIVIASLLAGDAAARDVQTGLHPLMYSAPLRKPQYLGGRFLAAFTLNALILLAVPATHLAVTFASGLEQELIGPFQLTAYASAYVLLGLANAFIATAMLFSLAALTRRAMTSYLGSVLLLFMSMFTSLFVAQQLGMWELAKLIDPLGLTVLTEMVRTWSPLEQNARGIGGAGWLLANRMIWLTSALIVLTLTHLRFRFAHHTPRAWFARRHRGAAPTAVDRTSINVPQVRGHFGFATHVRQTFALTMDSFREIVLGWGGFALLVLTIGTALAGPSWFTQVGVPLLPTTARLIDFLVVPLANVDEILLMVMPLLMVFYAGELVWRDRDARMSDIVDASPLSEWSLLLGKFLAFCLVLVSYQLLSIFAGVLIQLQMGYHDFQIGLYVQTVLGLAVVDYILFALVAIAVHVVINQKYIAHMALLLVYAYISFATTLGIEHNLLVFAGAPSWSYSDMRGYGSSLAPWFWFKAYWAAWTLLIGIIAKLCWVRGKELSLTWRRHLARRRLTRGLASASAVAIVLIMTLGGFIFYHTNVLNPYETASESLERSAEYERRYARFKDVAQPQLAGTRLQVDIFPDRAVALIRGTHALVNATPRRIDTLHIATSTQVRTVRISFDRAAARTLADTVHDHHVYVLAAPLWPGDSMRLTFEVAAGGSSFSNDGAPSSVVANGSYFTNSWLPAIGYQPARELSNAGDRRQHGLLPQLPVPSMADVAARYDLHGEERIPFAAVISTTADQLAVAPGRLRRTWTAAGRRYFEYVTDAPIRNDYAIFSANYAIDKARWRGVDTEVFYHRRHGRAVPTMTRALQATLDYQTRNFGAYAHGQLRLVEHPGSTPTLHAYPVNVSFEEGFTALNAAGDTRRLDFPFAVVAHEVAHQWWGNQLMPAQVEGGALLSESLAWYSAFGAVEATYGTEHMERLVGVMRDAYLAPQSRAAVPLLRAYNWFLAYRKGPLALYAVREYVGAEQVTTALRSLLTKHGAGKPPLPTSLDLYRELQAVTPDSLRYLLADLFEHNTFWELAVERVTARQRADRSWQVTLDVNARKVVVDTLGVESEVPMNDYIEIGVFAASASEAAEPLYVGMHRIRSGSQRITLTVARRPARAGIDPRQLLIDDDKDDNHAEVVVAKTTAGR